MSFSKRTKRNKAVCFIRHFKTAHRSFVYDQLETVRKEVVVVVSVSVGLSWHISGTVM